MIRGEGCFHSTVSVLVENRFDLDVLEVLSTSIDCNRCCQLKGCKRGITKNTAE